MRDEIVAIEAELGVAPSSSYSTVKARLDAGWQPIDSGSPSAATSFSVTIPASTYRIVRIHIWGTLATGVEELTARVNNDSTAGLHQYALGRVEGDSSAVGAVNTSRTEWHIGWVTGTAFAIFDLWIYAADASSQCPFRSEAGNYHATGDSARLSKSVGRLSANRTLSSVQIIPTASSFTGGYVAEGYRVP
jgi:hypothetical protein